MKALNVESFNPDYDYMFQRGIDPDVDDPTKCHDHPEMPPQWPERSRVVEYRNRVRETLRDNDRMHQLDSMGMADMSIEHDLMHIETLLYMVLQLDKKFKRWSRVEVDAAKPLLHRISGEDFPDYVRIPEGTAKLGRNRETKKQQWGWDNEFGELEVQVNSFEASTLPVTVGEYVEFMRAGGYNRESLWQEEDWKWRKRESLSHPKCLIPKSDSAGEWEYLTIHCTMTIEEARDLPIYVSLGEARAYAAWKGKRLPTEAEWHRMAFARPGDGEETDYPWGDEKPVAGVHGNFGFKYWIPVGVGRFPAGKSAFGVLDLVGNGWELTDTPFEPFPGFEVDPDYPGYSSDFFEGKHFVLKGGSWATETQLIRKTFRNWYQRNYPYVFSKFRLVSY
mmetsp:Transcript_36223/g.144877  ORF Transcript_36223/g.144877 Transcript_36223/m.144877 type:complete len:392 (+) Transcript_36223:268-1443(+)